MSNNACPSCKQSDSVTYSNFREAYSTERLIPIGKTTESIRIKTLYPAEVSALCNVCDYQGTINVGSSFVMPDYSLRA